MTARYFRSSLSSSSPLTHSVLARSSVFWGDEILNDGGKWNGMMMMMAAAAALVVTGNGRKNTTECCGIVGVIGTKNYDARDFLLEGLTVLKNRGYDSAGIATISHSSGPLTITKYASDGDNADGIKLVTERSLKSAGHSVGIAHTRWATHGGKTDENAHPHTDSTGKVAVVHNGTINNANPLRKELINLGHTFTSQTDTEVIAKLIGHYRDTMGKTATIQSVTEMALSRCEGTWGLCVLCSDSPDELIVACNGSPMVIGLSDDRTFVASETSAFNRHTKNFISMKDGEIGVLKADGTTSLDLSRKQLAPDQDILLSPDPFPHWTLKELTEQPEAVGRSLGFGGRLSPDRVLLGGLDAQMEKLSKIRFMTLSACGTSLHAAKYAERLMKKLGSFQIVTASDAAETGPRDFPRTADPKETGLIVVSQSGETKDVARVLSAAIDGGVTVMSVVNAVGSMIARTTKLGVYCQAGRENAVASTKAFTTQVTVLALIALWFQQLRDDKELTVGVHEATRLREALMRLPISLGMAMKGRDKCREIAKRLDSKEHLFVLGKGYGEPVALEGALKIKEMCYLHAEGYSGGALKHGPFALIENDVTGKFGATPIILLILDDEHAQHMRTCAEEVKARGAELIVITDKAELAEGLCEDPLVVPHNGPLTALGAVIPLQLIAYELALIRGINPDTPRNLAKAVTVD